MTTQVFVGGSHDGERVRVIDGYKSLQLLHKEDLEALNDRILAPEEKKVDIRREEYVLFPLVAGEKVFSVFSLAGMEPSEVVGALIDGYRKGGG